MATTSKALGGGFTVEIDGLEQLGYWKACSGGDNVRHVHRSRAAHSELPDSVIGLPEVRPLRLSRELGLGALFSVSIDGLGELGGWKSVGSITMRREMMATRRAHVDTPEFVAGKREVAPIRLRRTMDENSALEEWFANAAEEPRNGSITLLDPQSEVLVGIDWFGGVPRSYACDPMVVGGSPPCEELVLEVQDLRVQTELARWYADGDKSPRNGAIVYLDHTASPIKSRSWSEGVVGGYELDALEIGESPKLLSETVVVHVRSIRSS